MEDRAVQLPMRSIQPHWANHCAIQLYVNHTSFVCISSEVRASVIENLYIGECHTVEIGYANQAKPQRLTNQSMISIQILLSADQVQQNASIHRLFPPRNDVFERA